MRTFPDLLASSMTSRKLLGFSEPQLLLLQTGNYPHATDKEIETKVTELINGMSRTHSVVLSSVLLFIGTWWTTPELSGLKQPPDFAHDVIGKDLGKAQLSGSPLARVGLAGGPLSKCLSMLPCMSPSPYGVSPSRSSAFGLGFLTTRWCRVTGLLTSIVGLLQNECSKRRKVEVSFEP